ncbi:hypothetical protein RR48_14258 [Papilio machaon]|uniref:Uncharacterized protein n=1 Tax=Papilio machaon TaxID=76193 RepID=A0A194QMD6_PAPMA|nr:hypothetical protein RR48_14258 [Papilio machaon]
MATSGGKSRREEASDNSDDELTPLANEIYGGSLEVGSQAISRGAARNPLKCQGCQL